MTGLLPVVRSATTPTRTTPSDQVTRPDQLPPGGWLVIDLLGREQILACWRTPLGFLVLTNLRCSLILRKVAIFHPKGWELGPQFFFYNLRPPRVVLGRFVELAEEFEEEGGLVSRIAVDSPRTVAEKISAAIGPGQAEWARRRSASQRLIEARRRQREALARAFATGAPAEVVRVPCAYCGCPMPVSSNRCPTCGAPAT